MLITNDISIHGLTQAYAHDGVEVSYAYPGSLEVRLAAGVTMPATSRAQRIVLGMLLTDPDEQDPRDDRSWRWAEHTNPATRRWAQHVLAADHREETLVYEHDGEIVLVWAFVPARAHELALLEAGFTPALATWRAPATPETRTLAAQMARHRPSPAPGIGAAPPPMIGDDEREPANEVEHLWLRWAALADTRVLQLHRRTYDFRAPPQRDGSTLVLRYRTRKHDLRLAFDVGRHPLVYDVTVGVGDRGEPLTQHDLPGVAWEDFPALVAAIEAIVAGKPAATAGASPVVALPAAPTAASPASRHGEQMEGPHRRADVWETVIASVLAGFDLPESLPLYPLARRLTDAALAAVDEQAAHHGDDYMDSLRRRDAAQVARLAQLEQRLYAVLTEAEPFGGLAAIVRHVVGLADGSIRRPPAGTASEAFWRTWAAPKTLTLRGRVFSLRQHQVLFESSSVELRYSVPASSGGASSSLALSVGLPNRRGLCEVRATLWSPGAAEQSAPWQLTVPQLEKLTGAAIVRQLKPVTPAAAADDGETWEDALVATFKAQDPRDPQLRLERRLGSGSRIFVLTMPGRRPEPIVGRVDINAELEIESLDLTSLPPVAQAAQRRRLDAALEAVRQQFGDEDEASTYAAARKKALSDAPLPALVDRLAQHLASQREAAAVLELRAQARSDLSAAARMVLALATPPGPSPSETAEWLDDQRLSKSAALLSSYIFTPEVALDTFLTDLSTSLEAEMGARRALLKTDGTLKVLNTMVREGERGHYMLEAAGTRVRVHDVTVLDRDARFANVAVAGPTRHSWERDEIRFYSDEERSEATIREVWDRYDALLHSLLRAPVQLEEMRQMLLVAAELVDAPKCQGAAKGNAERALAAAQARYADARTELQRGRDARAIDRLREVLRAVVQVAHSSAESCAAGQTALLDLAVASANYP